MSALRVRSLDSENSILCEAPVSTVSSRRTIRQAFVRVKIRRSGESIRSWGVDSLGRRKERVLGLDENGSQADFAGAHAFVERVHDGWIELRSRKLANLVHR